jgi:hypothetical protein
MEAIKLQKLLKDVEVELVVEAGRVMILVRHVSKVLVDLGMPPIPTSWRWWASSWNACGRPMPLAMAPGIRRRPLAIVSSIGYPVLVFCFSSFISCVKNILRTQGL